jgi:hypothetical protein
MPGLGSDPPSTTQNSPAPVSPLDFSSQGGGARRDAAPSVEGLEQPASEVMDEQRGPRGRSPARPRCLRPRGAGERVQLSRASGRPT